MNDDRSEPEATDAFPTAVNGQVTDSAEGGEDGPVGDDVSASEPGVPVAPTKLGVVPSSYGEPGG
jgi:hypothetical protein